MPSCSSATNFLFTYHDRSRSNYTLYNDDLRVVVPGHRPSKYPPTHSPMLHYSDVEDWAGTKLTPSETPLREVEEAITRGSKRYSIRQSKKNKGVWTVSAIFISLFQ